MSNRSRNPEARAAIAEAIERLGDAAETLRWMHRWKNIECSSIELADELHGVLMSIIRSVPGALDNSIKNVYTRDAQSDSGKEHGRIGSKNDEEAGRVA
jgi:hypothetical protein